MVDRMMTGMDYRAELARRCLLIYEVAAVIGIHPVRLGRMLRGKEPLTESIRRRLDNYFEQQRRQNSEEV